MFSVGELNPCGDRLIAEYLEHAPPAAVEDAVETLAGPNLLRMVHTRHGAAAAVAVIAYGAPKDRKKAVKAFSGADLVSPLASRPGDGSGVTACLAMQHCDVF